MGKHKRPGGVIRRAFCATRVAFPSPAPPAPGRERNTRRRRIWTAAWRCSAAGGARSRCNSTTAAKEPNVNASNRYVEERESLTDATFANDADYLDPLAAAQAYEWALRHIPLSADLRLAIGNAVSELRKIDREQNQDEDGDAADEFMRGRIEHLANSGDPFAAIEMDALRRATGQRIVRDDDAAIEANVLRDAPQRIVWDDDDMEMD